MMDPVSEPDPTREETEVIVKIEFNTEDVISEKDVALLKILAGLEDVQVPVKAAPEKKAPAKKAAPSPEPEPVSEPVAAELPADTEALRDAVAALASELLANGGRATVLEALQGAGGGAARVSEVEDEHLQAFHDALAG
jgi:hypothetical protein